MGRIVIESWILAWASGVLTNAILKPTDAPVFNLLTLLLGTMKILSIIRRTNDFASAGPRGYKTLKVGNQIAVSCSMI